jgi:hypothetical protein
MTTNGRSSALAILCCAKSSFGGAFIRLINPATNQEGKALRNQ